MNEKQNRLLSVSMVCFLLAFLVMLLPWSLPEVFSPGPETRSVLYTSFLDFRYIGFGDFLPPLCFAAFVVWAAVTESRRRQDRLPSVAGLLFGAAAAVFALLRCFWFSASTVFPAGPLAIFLLLLAALAVQTAALLCRG